MALRNVALLLLALTGLSWFATSAEAAEWGYGEGKSGPDGWPGMCQTGTRQSPIDLDPEKTIPGGFEPLVLLNYDRKVRANITNNGHTVMLQVEQPCDMVMAAAGLPGVYQLDQIHFHWKSEHTFQGKRLPLEMHLVHHNREYRVEEATKHYNGIAVLGVLFSISSTPNKALTSILDAVDRVHDEGTQNLPQTIVVEDLFPVERKSFYRYHGSLTTPSCDESVIWTVFTHVVHISGEQLDRFHKIKSHHQELKANYRPIQKMHKRRIYLQQSNELSSVVTAMSSKITLSWALVLISGMLSLFS